MSFAIERTTPPAAAGGGQVEPAIGGMTCASCAARIEKKLNRLESSAFVVSSSLRLRRFRTADGAAPAGVRPGAAADAAGDAPAETIAAR